MKFHLKYLLKIGMGLAILFFIFYRLPFQEILNTIQHSRPDLFLAALFFGGLSIAINTLRWQTLLSSLGYVYPLSTILKLSFIALFFNIYFPGGVIGDIAKSTMLPPPNNPSEEKKARFSRIAASVIVDRVIGLVSVMLLASAGIIFSPQLFTHTHTFLLFVFVVTAIMSLCCVIFSRRVKKILKKIILYFKFLNPLLSTLAPINDTMILYREKMPSLFRNLILISIFSQLCVICYFFLLAASIHVNIHFLKLLIYVPVIELMAALPLTQGGLGIREATTMLLFSFEGISGVNALSVSLLSFVLLLILGAPGGLFFLRSRAIQKCASPA